MQMGCRKLNTSAIVLAFKKGFKYCIMCLGNDYCILHCKETTDAVIGGIDIFSQSYAFAVSLPSLGSIKMCIWDHFMI